MNPKKKTTETDSDQLELSLPSTLPVLLSVDLVAFPHVMMSLYIEHGQSVKAVQAALDGDSLLLVIAQSGDDLEGLSLSDINKVGVVCTVVKMLQLADGRHKVLVQGLVRGKASRLREKGGYLVASVAQLKTKPFKKKKEVQEILQRLFHNLQLLVEHEYLPEELLLIGEEIEDPAVLADIITAHYKLEVERAQAFLEEVSDKERLLATDELLTHDLHSLMVSEGIKDRTREELSRGQRDYFLREQLKQIQRELGEESDGSTDLETLREAFSAKELPDHARKEVELQLGRLERMHAEGSEYAMLRTYLEWILDLPWLKLTRDRFNIAKAEEILNEDHFGLDDAKERILEFLSVRKLNKNSKGPILCLVGPPGVGKTSLGRSVARCLNRTFFRMSLGGVRDEAEMRGHRRTYVGALPGRFIQGLKEAGSSNPVFLLDELDKIGADFRGDPASALLEILDPSQNKTFRDHYLNIDYDLSRCLFIATANTTDTIPEPLLDRLEVLHISGYTATEKLKIAERYLLPRQLKENGLVKKEVTVAPDAIEFLIERYTREAGVRSLDRMLAKVCRKVARKFVESGEVCSPIGLAELRELLGPTRFDPDTIEGQSMVGLVQGLAWTAHGGEVLSVEASTATGKGRLSLTGRLGEVMQESAQAALFYARSHSEELGLAADFNETTDIHVHLPGGATPKDGPSAGITIVTAIVSALTGRPVSHKVAMTGEITLRGAVLPVGGLKEKTLAALRYGLHTVLIPEGNRKDIEEIPEEQRAQIEIIPVKHVREVIAHALLPEASTKRAAGSTLAEGGIPAGVGGKTLSTKIVVDGER